MMISLFPDVSRDCPLYEKRYNEVKFMCKSGRRLAELASCFGTGLICLVPFEGAPTDPLIGLLGYA